MRSRKALAAALAGGIACGGTALRAGGLPPRSPAAVGNEWKTAAPGYPWTFPADHWAHEGFRTEWWYFVGIARSEEGRRFAWQFTLFRSGLVPPSVRTARSRWASRHAFMGHAAVADLDSGARTFVQTVAREAPGLAAAGRFPDPGIASMPGPPGTPSPWTLRFEDGRFRIEAADAGSGLRIALAAVPTRPPLLHGEGGHSEKSPGGAASNYYSLTRMEVTGELALGGTGGTVGGWAWMDREFGSGWLAPDQTGWDWFALRLEDGRDLMLYLLRSEDGSLSHLDGTVLEADGRTARRVPNARVEVLARQDAAGSDGGDPAARPYPSAWRVRVPGTPGSPALDLRVLPLLEDQENRRSEDQTGPDIPYWEGAVEVFPASADSPSGSGFVELTGYRKPMSLRVLAAR